MNFRANLSVLLLSVIATSGVLSRAAVADEICSKEYRKELAYLLRQKSGGVNDLKTAIADIPNAPASAKNKEERGFCTAISKGFQLYKTHASRQAFEANVSASTLKDLKVMEAFENSAFQFVRLNEGYCENKDCSGGWFESNNCSATSVQGRVDRIRADVPRIDALYARIEEEKNRCQERTSSTDALLPHIASAIPGAPENPARKVSDRVLNDRSDDSGQSDGDSASRSAGVARE